MDWILLLILGVALFLAWHVMATPHPDAVGPAAGPEAAGPAVGPAAAAPRRKDASMVQKASTVFAEPGLSGQVIDPVPTARQVPLETPMFSTLAAPY